jgi:hypothetical protein
MSVETIYKVGDRLIPYSRLETRTESKRNVNRLRPDGICLSFSTESLTRQPTTLPSLC